MTLLARIFTLLFPETRLDPDATMLTPWQLARVNAVRLRHGYGPLDEKGEALPPVVGDFTFPDHAVIPVKPAVFAQACVSPALLRAVERAMPPTTMVGEPVLSVAALAAMAAKGTEPITVALRPALVPVERGVYVRAISAARFARTGQPVDRSWFDEVMRMLPPVVEIPRADYEREVAPFLA